MMTPFTNWYDLIGAPRSAFFKGHTQDTVHDQSSKTPLSPSSESLFTQSNARVLVGHAANGMLRMIALPTQVYPAPTQTSEFGLGPGMYHHFDVVMYAGNLTYKIVMDDGRVMDMGTEDRDNETVYADHFIPITTTHEGDLEITTVSFAPVAPDATHAALSPAPLPGPAGAFHVLIIRNTGSKGYSGIVKLSANDLLVGHYEDAAPELHAINKPTLSLRQHTLILNRPEGCAGVHLCDGHWSIQDDPYTAQRDFTIAPGEEQVFETHIAMGADFYDIMPTLYALHMRSALDWLNLTAGYWHSRLGNLTVTAAHSDAGEFSRDLYIRILFDNFNCLQTDANGNLIAHWQGAPSHGYGTVWGIDVEPTAVSVVHLCPEIARQTLRQNAAMDASRAGINAAELVSMEVQTFGENGYLFKRYGPAQLWGHWDADKLWDMVAMPLALRFVILNDTSKDWADVQVTLQCPAGWTAQGRRPKHWDRADHRLPGHVNLNLGDLPASSTTVAPFWVQEPQSLQISKVWWNTFIGPFHQATQPGDGLRLYSKSPNGGATVTFKAELSAKTPEGTIIQKAIHVPIQIVPVCASEVC